MAKKKYTPPAVVPLKPRAESAEELRKAADLDIHSDGGNHKAPDARAATELGHAAEQSARAQETGNANPQPRCPHCRAQAKISQAQMGFDNGLLSMIFFCWHCEKILSIVPIGMAQPTGVVGVRGNPTARM